MLPIGEVVLISVIMVVVVGMADVDFEVDSWTLVVYDDSDVIAVSLLVDESLNELEYLVDVSWLDDTLLVNPADVVVVVTVVSVVGVMEDP